MIMVSRVEKVGAQPLVEAGAGMPKSPTDGLILSNGLASKPSNTARYGVRVKLKSTKNRCRLGECREDPSWMNR